MDKNLIIVIVSLTVVYTGTAIPQQFGRQRRPNQNIDEQTLQETIEGIFPAPTTTEQSYRGAGAIVTPDPTFTPTTSPQMLTVNEQSCTCTPYHVCTNILLLWKFVNTQKYIHI